MLVWLIVTDLIWSINLSRPLWLGPLKKKIWKHWKLVKRERRVPILGHQLVTTKYFRSVSEDYISTSYFKGLAIFRYPNYTFTFHFSQNNLSNLGFWKEKITWNQKGSTSYALSSTMRTITASCKGIVAVNVIIVQRVSCPFKNVWGKSLFNWNCMGKVK